MDGKARQQGEGTMTPDETRREAERLIGAWTDSHYGDRALRHRAEATVITFSALLARVQELEEMLRAERELRQSHGF